MKFKHKKFVLNIFITIVFLIFLINCHQPTASSEAPIFETLDSSQTHIYFKNQLQPNNQFNAFRYLYFYNGAGIGAGDFNNDGTIDLFFAGNQVPNKLYLNKGHLKFEDVSYQARINIDSAWNTGVSVVDINNDGLLDIYICRLGNFEAFKSKNQFLICQEIKNGIPLYQDQAQALGVDFSGLSTQAAFFDFDLDGDLDLFLLNHSVHQNGSFAPRSHFLNTYNPISGDQLYRNDGQKFTNITKSSNIHSSAISYGLGLVISDINLDGYPDIYNGNDFHENDYLYINQKNGKFKDLATTMFTTYQSIYHGR